MSFFTQESLDFWNGLAENNSKTWFDEHRKDYEKHLRQPYLELAEALVYGLRGSEPEYEIEPAKATYRINRDVRFSKDKTPYKNHIGAVTEADGGELYYVQLNSGGLFTATGMHQMARDQLERFYGAIDDDGTGSELVGLVDDLRRQRLEIGGVALKTAPRGYPKDHARVELLRHKGLTVGKTFPRAKWQSTPAAKFRFESVWSVAGPLNRWLATNVGPSTEPPPEAR